MKFLTLISAFIVSLYSLDLDAQLDLDAGFGVDGLLAFQGSGPTDEAILDLHVDGLERITFVYAGSGSQGLGRALSDATLDVSFGSAGIVTLDFAPRALVVAPDGSVTVGGTADDRWRLARFLSDGSIDTGFGNGGQLVIDWFDDDVLVSALALDGNGDVVAVGRAFDPAAGSGLAVAIVDEVGNIVEQRFDKLVAGRAEWCTDVLVQADGRIICVGLSRTFSNARMIAVRYLADLTPDGSFGVDGVVFVDTTANEMEAHAGALTPGGQVVLGGWVDRGSEGLNISIARLNGDGSIDTGFGTDGFVEAEITDGSSELVEDLVLDGTDLLVAASAQVLGDFAVLRFDANGDADNLFGTAGLGQVDFNGLIDVGRVLAIHQGNILIGGLASAAQRSEFGNLGLARLLDDGDPDPSFGVGGAVEIGLVGAQRTQVRAAARRGGGGSVAAVQFGSSFTANDFLLLGLDADGNNDPGFGSNGVARADFANDEDTAQAVAVQEDGRIVVAGSIRQSTQGSDFGVARFLPDGSPDPDFGIDGRVAVDLDGGTDTANAAVILADGRILVAGEGQFFNSGGDGDLAVIRLLSDGTLDTAFGTSGIANADSGASFEFGNALALRPGGGILVGGTGNGDFVLAAFNADGSADTGFDGDGIATLDFSGAFDSISALRVLPDWNGQGERIVAVGTARTGSSTATADFAAAMFRPDGTLESGFGNAGTVVQDLSDGSRDEATAAVVWNGQLVLAGFSGDFADPTRADYTLLGLSIDGQPIPEFSVSGADLGIDYFGDTDEAQAILLDGTELMLVGTVTDPLLPLFTNQLAGLARLSDVERLFSDGFEAP